jgi:hypothetical protein
MLETNLKPAHVLRIMGLLRFWRIVLSRDESSILHQVWDVIESHAYITDGHSLNGEIHRLQEKYSEQIGDTVPDPTDKRAWKELVDEIASHELKEWYASQQRTGGRLRTQPSPLNGLAPDYLTHPAITKHERRNIACTRTQCAAYIAAHAQHRDTKAFGNNEMYLHRYCQCQSCAGSRLLDDAAHVMLRCRAHVTERKIAASNPAHRAKTLAAIGTDTMELRLLLGSPPQHLRGSDA